MPSKLENITNLYKETLSDISGSSENWTSFLITASNNYKYNFAEQILIFSQRPEATACADIDTWNKQVKRWVNKGAKGIALLSEVNGRCVLRHVFDVSDTHNYYGTKLNLWKIENKYENEIIESLEARFGTFMTLTRCGINPFDYFEMDDFIDIYDFNTIDTISRLGVATSDIAETNLREIHNTINKLKINEKNQIYTFVKNQNVKDNIEKESERSVDYANNIQESRGLPNTQSNDRESKRESISRQVLSNKVKLSKGKQKRLDELNIKLNLNEKDKELFNDDIEELRNKEKNEKER